MEAGSFFCVKLGDMLHLILITRPDSCKSLTFGIRENWKHLLSRAVLSTSGQSISAWKH